MKCPYCGTPETSVLDSRSTDQDHVIRRRRECADCKRRFTTYERVEAEPILVLKKDGTREVFSREKLLGGLLIACKKTRIPIETLEEYVSSIERSLRDEGRREVPAVDLGKIVLSGLKLIDPVAYIRFASVYNEFESVAAFRKVIDDLEEKKA
jgi:transcriptional repressor NrdR